MPGLKKGSYFSCLKEVRGSKTIKLIYKQLK